MLRRILGSAAARPGRSAAGLMPGDWERLVASGQATDPTSPVDPRTIVPIDAGVDVSADLAAQRADER